MEIIAFRIQSMKLMIRRCGELNTTKSSGRSRTSKVSGISICVPLIQSGLFKIEGPETPRRQPAGYRAFDVDPGGVKRPPNTFSKFMCINTEG